MVDRNEGLLYDIGQGYSALDAQAARDRMDGYAVVSGGAVTPGGSLSVDVAAFEVTVGTDGSGNIVTQSTGSTTNVSLATADSTYPRKDTVWVDDTGTVQVTTGVAEQALPTGNTRFDTFQPEPPFPSGDGVILAEVWVGANATSLTTDDVRDRRQPAEVIGDTARFTDLDANTITNGDQTYSEGASMIHDRDEITSTTATTDGSGYYLVDTDAAGAATTLTLSNSDSIEGREVNVKREGETYDLTINAEGGQTIDGSNNIKLKSDQESVTLVFNNSDSDWEIW